MYISWCFDSIILLLINFIVTLYFGRKFFRVMRNHHRLVAEITEFNTIVCESRLSLDFTSTKVSEAMKEIENDINEEFTITHSLTKISEKMASLLTRFTALEEEVIELVRTNYNMTSITIATPTDINAEVKKILQWKRKQSKSSEKRAIDNATSKCLIRNMNHSVIE